MKKSIPSSQASNLTINNRQTRWLWLHGQGLGKAPTGKLNLMAIIKALGFVQLDTIQVVSRAHHHILWSRNQNYREPMLDKLFKGERQIFEHFTHDASILPMAFYPMWQRQFMRMKAYIDGANWWKDMPDEEGRQQIKARIEKEGALSTHAFESKKTSGKIWARTPHKQALDYMWYCGELGTAYRKNFVKYYDVAERIFPTLDRTEILSDEAQINWLCENALRRLQFATLKEIQEFWDAVSLDEVKDWHHNNQTDLIKIAVENHDGTWREAFAYCDIENALSVLKPPTSRLRILNPFDPAIRDRKRFQRLFGFHYKNEMFTPKAKREYGYYVYPILEGDRFVGRIEVKADRQISCLNVLGLWWEEGIEPRPNRLSKLDAELSRMARFIGVEKVNFTV